MSTPTTTKPLRDRERRFIGPAEGPANDLTLKFVVLAGLTALLVMTIGFVKPILMAGLFAATLYPFHKKLKARIPSEDIRAAVLTLGFAVLFLFPLGAVVFMATNAGLRKLKSLPENWLGQIEVEPLLLKIEGYLPYDRTELMGHLQEAGTALGKIVLGLLQGLLADIPKLVVVNMVILIGVYVTLVHAKRILLWLHKLSPLSQPRTERLFTAVGSLSASSVFATIVSGLVQATILGIVMAVLSWPGALLITMSAFVLSFVPLVGTAPVSLFLIVSAAIAGDWTHVIVFAITAFVVGISDNIVRPYVLSDSAQLNGFVAFVAALGALETMGFYGLFLGPVVAGAVLKLVELVHEERKA